MTLFSSDIYSIYFDSQGKPRRGEWILSLNVTEEPSVVLSNYLKLGTIFTRREESLLFITSKEGDGYIPILTFHKLGQNNNFELRPNLFEELLIFLKANEFYVISDYQYLTENFTFADNGKKLIVLGSDDASTGTFSYQTAGDRKTGPLLMDKGDYLISKDSMVYYLDQHLPKEQGIGNFTFYVTFDAIPFRQTGGGFNPGHPYKSMFTVLSKLQYLESNYLIGNHTANHLYTENLSETDFVKELIDYYNIMESYGINTDNIKTLAYSFGIGEITPEREHTVQSFRYRGSALAGAFDYNGYFTRPLSSQSVNPFDVSRIGVDNSSYDKIMTMLENTDIFRNRRVVIFESDEYLFDLSSLILNRNDFNYILIRK